MSDHAWVLENIAGYVAGGLSAAERERIEKHAQSCESCGSALDEARAVDAEVSELFAGQRPRSGIEDRVIRALRTAPAPRASFRPLWRVAMGVAAAGIFGLLGAAATGSISELSFGSRTESIPCASVRTQTTAQADLAVKEKSVAAMAQSLRSEMAGKMFERRGLTDAQNDEPEIFFPQASESDHNESADAEEYARMKGDSSELRSYAAPGAAAGRYGGRENAIKKSEKMYDSMGVGGGGGAGYFKPGDAAAPAPGNTPTRDSANDEKASNEQRKQTETKQGQDPQDQPAPQRKIIRNGEMEFEVEAFDSTVATITKIVGEEGGFVSTVNSQRLANKKVQGVVVVRVPPDRLDTLILKLRALGDLKSQNVSSQDVTKQYTDLESQLRAYRAIEERLLNIIKTGKGEIKDLLEAEKQLGEYRVKIEQVEGEIRYYAAQIALSTLTIRLYEKDIRTPAGATERENVNLGIETEDVEKAYKDALAAVADAKGRVTNSDLKKFDADQMLATICCQVGADASGPFRDRLQQLGRVTRLDITRTQTTDGTGLGSDIQVKRAESVFQISIYNLANVQARETVALTIASADAEDAYKTILARIAKAAGRVITSQFNRDRLDRSSGAITFEIRAAEADAVLTDVKAAGEVVALIVSENPDTQNVTKSKRGFQLLILALGLVQPRETTSIKIAARDVPAAYRALQEAVAKAKGIVRSAQLAEGDSRNVTATLDFDVRREEEAAIVSAMSTAGVVVSRSVSRAPEGQQVIEGKTRFVLNVASADSFHPRVVTTLAIEVGDVEKTVSLITDLVVKNSGRVLDQPVSREPDGRVTAKLVFDVPLAAVASMADNVRKTGTLRVQRITPNPNVPESDLAIARFDVTLSNAELIIPADGGFVSNIRQGLSTGFSWIAKSLMFVIVGILFVLPWALAIWGGWKLVARLRKPTPSTNA